MNTSRQQMPFNGQSPSTKKSFWPFFFKIVIPLVITVGLCWKLFSDIDIGEMWRIIRTDCNFIWIATAMVISIFSHVFRAMRWRIQLRAIDVNPPLFPVVLSIFGTYAVNLVFPRLGEIWRTGYISQRQHAPFDGVFGSMIADRLADSITVALMTFATFVFAGGPLVSYLSQGGENALLETLKCYALSPWTYIVALVAVAVVWLIFRRFVSAGFKARFKEFGAGLWRGMSAVATMPGRGRWLVLTICIWGCYFLQLYVAFFAFPATAKVVADYGAGAVMMCFVLSSIAMVVPSNGGIGPWQYAVIFGLSIYSAGIPELTAEYSASFANLVLGSQTLLLIALGLFTFICIAIHRRFASTGLPNKP